MNRHSSAGGLTRWTACFTLIALAMSPATLWAGEKRKISGTGTFVSMSGKTSGHTAENPKREMAQWTAIWSFTANLPDFDGVIETAPTQSVDGAGPGRHQGLLTFRHRNGDETYGYFHGTHEVVPKNDGTWDMNIDGVKVIIGGTGKFANAKGTLRYTAKSAPFGAQFSYTGEVEY